MSRRRFKMLEYRDAFFGLVCWNMDESVVEEKLLSSRYWDFVQQGGWPDEYLDSKLGVKARILANMKKSTEVEEFYFFVHACEQLLGRRVERWERVTHRSLELSDDGWSDCMSHIVGLGKEEFVRTLKNPELAWKRSMAGYGKPGGYQESFLYCIPDAEDYDRSLKS
tara:strand:- start:860 stop:1360 length:501 start_codon:yes stop_codon:yes gene_type:complete